MSTMRMLACLIAAFLIPALLFSSCGPGGGCDEGADVSAQATVESSRLVSDSQGLCRIEGTVFNDAGIDAHVEIQFRAFETGGRPTRDPVAGIFGGLLVPTHSRARYSTGAISRAGSDPATFLSCSEIAGFELVRVKATENACGPRTGLP